MTKPEDPTDGRSRYVLVAKELLEQMSEGWSEPLRVKITADDGQVIEMLFMREGPN